MGTEIERKLADAGYRMLGMDEEEKLILSILKTENTRYLKAIPFLIYIHDMDAEKIYPKTDKKKIFSQIIAFTKKIFEENNIKKELPQITGEGGLDYDEFKREFELQKANLARPGLMIEKQEIYAERDLQMWLSQIFTKKEKQIIRRIMEEKPVSKTDYEYYSRKTKKKLSSIINLQEFARTLHARTPKYDEELFYLKKKLETWIEENSEDREISIIRYFIWDNEISISYKKKGGKYPEEPFSITRKIKEIKDEDILKLLGKYSEHDFK